LKDRFEEEAPRKNRTVQSHAIYGAMVEAMDLAIGKVLDALDTAGVADRTLVIFTSDNGGLSTSEGSPTSNLPHRAGKGWLYEGGIREPVIVRWPGVTPEGATTPWMMTSTDIFPTILDAAGHPALPEQHKDGVSFVPALKQASATNTDRPLYFHFPHWGNQGGIPGAAVRMGDWKLIDWFWKKPAELFHLGKDPGERSNVAAEHPDKVAELRKILDAFHADTRALMPHPNPNPPKQFDKW
jgi:arylsulfatase A-like enzyme